MKNLILVAILLLVVSTLSFAQITAGPVAASVTATVTGNLAIAKTNDLAIGNVAKGATRTILSNAAGAAAFTISGEVSVPTTVTVTFPANLVDLSANTLPFTGQIPIHNTAAVQGGATTFPGLAGGTTPTDATTGNLYLWIGGGVTAAAGQVAGNYTGTINVSIVQ
jgi:hypothetical protein